MTAVEPFRHHTSPMRVAFGRGSIAVVPDEVRRLGASRALVLSTPHQRGVAGAVVERLAGLAAGVFDGAVSHTPVDVTDRAVAALSGGRADCVVAVGGGSTTGLGKAIAARTGVPQVVVPTTYAGSEVTQILGETRDGRKVTRRGSEILPESVVYDPDLTDSLPLPLTVTSGLNAMAHAAEGVYARDGSPVHTLIAIEGLRAMRDALRTLAGDPGDRDGRDGALYAAWLCGTVLGAVGMSVHHKLCHTLGGALDLPHAETHAILLPHTIAFVEQAVPKPLAPVAALFGGRAGPGLYDFAAFLGAPQSLAGLGVTQDDLDRVADLAMADPYDAPRPLERTALRELLHLAWKGERPAWPDEEAQS